MHIFKKKKVDYKITRKKYPRIFHAFDLIIADNVASSATIKKIKAKLSKGFKINDCKINPQKIEFFLSNLFEDQLEAITMGNQDEAKEAFGKMHGFEETNKLLNTFFESM